MVELCFEARVHYIYAGPPECLHYFVHCVIKNNNRIVTEKYRCSAIFLVNDPGYCVGIKVSVASVYLHLNQHDFFAKSTKNNS